MDKDIEFMKLALIEAQKAANEGEVPIGCVIISGNEVIATGHNLREQTHDATAHAEIVAIRNANQLLNTWHLDDCTLYVTLEPCAMCAGAIINSRVKRVVVGALDPKAGSTDSIVQLFNKDLPYNHHPEIVHGLLAEESRDQLQSFFRAIRDRKK